jgi:hypothetical protein
MGLHSKKRSTRRSLWATIHSAFVMDEQPWWNYDEETLQRFVESRMK